MSRLARFLNVLNPFRRAPEAVTFTGGRTIREDPGWLSQYGSGFNQNGKVVITESTALNLSTVWAAVRVIAGAVSILPLKVYSKGKDGAREEVRGDLQSDPAALLCETPNQEMTPVTFWETLITHVLTWGNCYAEIERNAYGDPVALYPIPPNLISPVRKDDGKIVYRGNVDGRTTDIEARNVFHVAGLGWDGLKGYSVVGMARQSLEVAASYEQGSKSFAENSFRPAGALKYPGSLQQLQKQAKQEELKAEHAGATRWGKMLLLYGGMEWQPFGIPMTDAQFLETRVFQVSEVARWFNVPQHMLRELSRATFSNIEHQGQDFVTYTLMYWLTKVTQEFKRKLLVGRPEQYAEHTTEALLRGDTINRYRAYGIARQWGWMSVNDVRRKENQPPIKGGDEFLVPVNMRPANSPWPPPKGNNQSGGTNGA